MFIGRGRRLTRSPSPTNMTAMDYKRELEIRQQVGGEAPCPTCKEPRKALLGSKLREKREAAGIGLREVAKKAGLSPSYVSDLERGKRNLGMAAADRLLRVIGS
jgi:predicted transcriptional regulator